MHSLFSDGELLPSELARRALKLNHEAIAITDHVDWSNVDTIPAIQDAIDDINSNWDITVVLGAEVTHAPCESIDGIAARAKELGANGIIAIRFDSNEISNVMQEILVYGTAVVVEKE